MGASNSCSVRYPPASGATCISQDSPQTQAMWETCCCGGLRLTIHAFCKNRPKDYKAYPHAQDEAHSDGGSCCCQSADSVSNPSIGSTALCPVLPTEPSGHQQKFEANQGDRLDDALSSDMTSKCVDIHEGVRCKQGASGPSTTDADGSEPGICNSSPPTSRGNSFTVTNASEEGVASCDLLSPRTDDLHGMEENLVVSMPVFPPIFPTLVSSGTDITRHPLISGDDREWDPSDGISGCDLSKSTPSFPKALPVTSITRWRHVRVKPCTDIEDQDVVPHEGPRGRLYPSHSRCFWAQLADPWGAPAQLLKLRGPLWSSTSWQETPQKSVANSRSLGGGSIIANTNKNNINAAIGDVSAEINPFTDRLAQIAHEKFKGSGWHGGDPLTSAVQSRSMARSGGPVHRRLV